MKVLYIFLQEKKIHKHVCFVILWICVFVFVCVFVCVMFVCLLLILCVSVCVFCVTGVCFLLRDCEDVQWVGGIINTCIKYLLCVHNTVNGKALYLIKNLQTGSRSIGIGRRGEVVGGTRLTLQEGRLQCNFIHFP